MNCDGCKYKGIERVCEACKKAHDSASVSAADMERASCRSSVEKKKDSRSHPFSGCVVRIKIHSRRHRLCDADGISAKAAIDGLVLAGILEGDSPEFVGEVSYSQEKSKVEETIITIEEVCE